MGFKAGSTTRLTHTVKALKIVLDGLEEDDEFNIVSFSSDSTGKGPEFTTWKNSVVRKNAQNVDEAKKWLDGQKPTLGTILGKVVS